MGTREDLIKELEAKEKNLEAKIAKEKAELQKEIDEKEKQDNIIPRVDALVDLNVIIWSILKLSIPNIEAEKKRLVKELDFTTLELYESKAQEAALFKADLLDKVNKKDTAKAEFKQFISTTDPDNIKAADALEFVKLYIKANK